jgi:hypothetical protein
MTALPAHDPPDHQRDDQEKLLRTFGAWQQEWDETADDAIQSADFATQVKFAIQCHAEGMDELLVRWKLIEQFGRRCRIGLVEAAVDRALKASRRLSREAKLAKVELQRSRAIQGALAAGEWGSAMRGIDRQGDALGELSAEAGLSADDLRLVVEIEGESLPLEPGTGEPIQGEQEQAEMAETGETGA